MKEQGWMGGQKPSQANVIAACVHTINERKGKERKGKGGNDQHHYYYCY